MIKSLTEEERRVVLACLRAIASGQFVGDFEMDGRIGASREELGRLIMRWPHVDDARDDSAACLAINNCLNEVCHGVAIGSRDWARWFGVDREEVKRVYRKWALARGWNHTGVR